MRTLLTLICGATVGCGAAPAQPTTPQSAPAEPSAVEAVADPAGVQPLVEVLLAAQGAFDELLADPQMQSEAGGLVDDLWIDATKVVAEHAPQALHPAAMSGVWSEALSASVRQVVMLSGSAEYGRDYSFYRDLEDAVRAAREALRAMTSAVEMSVQMHGQGAAGRHIRCLGARTQTFIAWSELRILIAHRQAELADREYDETEGDALLDLEQAVSVLVETLGDLNRGVEDLDAPPDADMAQLDSEKARAASEAMMSMREACAGSDMAMSTISGPETSVDAARAVSELWFAFGGSQVGMMHSRSAVTQSVVEANANQVTDALLSTMPDFVRLQLSASDIQITTSAAVVLLEAVGANRAGLQVPDEDRDETLPRVVEAMAAAAETLREIVGARTSQGPSPVLRCIVARMDAHDTWVQHQSDMVLPEGIESELTEQETQRQQDLIERAVERLSRPNSSLLIEIADEAEGLDRLDEWQEATLLTRQAAEACAAVE